MSLFVILSVTMVMGIPTVKRKVKSYLSETLRSLIDKLSPEEKLDCVIIVFVGEVRCRATYESLHVPAHSLKICKKGPPILTCGLDPCRLTWTMFTVWLPVWRKSEYFTGRRRKHNDIQWRACVFVTGLLTSLTDEQLLFRFSTELSSGLLEVISPPAAYYPDLTNLKETFGDSRERVR